MSDRRGLNKYVHYNVLVYKLCGHYNVLVFGIHVHHNVLISGFCVHLNVLVLTTNIAIAVSFSE